MVEDISVVANEQRLAPVQSTCVANLVRGVNNCQSKRGWNESPLEWPDMEHLDTIS